MHRRARSSRALKKPVLRRRFRLVINRDHLSRLEPITDQEILGSVKSTAAAEVWDADVLTAPALPLGSGAASLLAMPL